MNKKIFIGKIIKIKKESLNSITLFILINKNLIGYIAGQFISINPKQFFELSPLIAYLKLKKNKKEKTRAYSLSSIPSDNFLSITIKSEKLENSSKYPPLLSPLLTSKSILNKYIKFSGFFGHYIFNKNIKKNTSRIIHIIAGHGLIPNFSILKDQLILKKNIYIKHKVICINKKINDIMFLNIITLLEKKYSKRLKIINFITQEHNLKNYSLKINKGRPSIKNIKKEITSKKNMIMYVCGPSSVRENKKTNKLSIIRFTNFVKKIVEKSISIKKNKFKLKNESY